MSTEKSWRCLCVVMSLGFFLLALPTLGIAGDGVKANDVKTDSVAKDPPQSRLVRILTGRNEKLRLHTLAPFKRNPQATETSLDEFILALEVQAEQVTEGRPLTHSTAELIALIASVDQPRARESLIAQLNCDHLHVSMLCADALGRHQCIAALEPLKQQVEREDWKTHYGFRFNLIRALTLMDHPDAYEFLGKIRRHVDGQLLFEVDEIFKGVTLDDFLGDREQYDAWRKSADSVAVKGSARQFNPDSFFKNASYSESADRIKFQRQQYYGIDIEAKRLLFVIDHSGSMKAGASNNGRWGSRLWHAKAALIKAIEELPEDDEFGIIFYSESIHAWKKELVYATPENKRDATTFIYRLGVGGSTNTYGALRESMEFDDDLEAVFLLTDGIPSSGTIVQPKRIVADIVHRNRLRHLKINTIGIAVNGNTKLFLKSLAEKCSGEFTQPE